MTTKNSTPSVSTAAPSAATSAANPARAGEPVGEITHDSIRERAYEICKARNGGPGNECLDWLQAERELGATGDQGQPECCDPLVIETRVGASAPVHTQR